MIRALRAQAGQTASRVEPHGIGTTSSVPVARSWTRRSMGRPQTRADAANSRAIIGGDDEVRPGHQAAPPSTRVSAGRSVSAEGGEVVVGVVGEADPDGFGDAVDLDVADAGEGVGDHVARRAAQPGGPAEGEVDVLGLVQPEPDPDGEQVPLRQHVLARVLDRPDHDNTDRPALGQQQAEGGLDALLDGPVVHPRRERGQLVHHHHDQRLIRGRGVEPGDAEQPVLAFPHHPVPDPPSGSIASSSPLSLCTLRSVSA